MITQRLATSDPGGDLQLGPAEIDRRWPSHRNAISLPSIGPGADSTAFYRRIRHAHGPVAPVVMDGGVPAWLVLGYREVVYVASTPVLFVRDSRIWNAWDLVPADWPLQPVVGHRPSLRNLDGPAHERRLAALSEVLSAVDPVDLRARSVRGADGLIDAVAQRGHAELMAEYANPLPLLVLADMAGLPGGDLPAAVQDLTLMVNGGAGSLDAQDRIHALLTRLVRQYRDTPGHNIISALVTHPADLTDDEIVEDMMVALTAGQAPNADWIGNTLQLMLTDAAFAVGLSGGRRSVAQAMTETLWADPPIQNLMARWARRDIQLGGYWIRAGDLILFAISAAHADTAARPDRGSAGNHAHLAFGHGDHRCPYPAQEIAETVATTAIEVLLDRLPDLDLAVGPDELTWRPSAWVRGLAALPVRFTPR